MFKDYLFFSNNLQDAAKQILEAQEAQAKKENVDAVEPGPNEPMGQPLDEPAYDPAPTNNKVIPVNKQNGFVNKLSPKNKQAPQAPQDTQASYDKFDQDQQVHSNISTPEAIFRKKLEATSARQRDQEEATKQGLSLGDYYKLKAREKERELDKLEREQEERIEREFAPLRPGTVPWDELA
jgi:hypothetical protein